MKRFAHEKSYPWLKQTMSVALFLILFTLFLAGLSSVSEKTKEQRAKTLELSISQGITHCYATEGHYPESLDYLKEHYHIQYDTEEFFVDYQIMGENIFPDVTIIEK